MSESIFYFSTGYNNTMYKSYPLFLFSAQREGCLVPLILNKNNKQTNQII